MTAAVSVAMATFNGARFLRPQLDSLAAQTYPPAELVVNDDGSQDDTLALLEAFAAEAPFDVRVERNPQRLGYRANFVAAAVRCQGDLIAFCDQDDLWRADKLDVMAAAFADPEVLLAFHGARAVDTAGRPLGRIRGLPPAARIFAPLELEPFRIVLGMTQVFRSGLLPWAERQRWTVDPYHPGENLAHDQLFLMFASALGSVAYVDAELVDYRQHQGALFGRPANPLVQLVHDIVRGPTIRRGRRIAAANRAELMIKAAAILPDPQKTRAEAAAAFYRGLR